MYNERKSLTEYERNTNFRIMFKDHFKTMKNKYFEKKSLFFFSDSFYNLTYILTDPILIVQTETLEVVDRLKINENIKIDRDSKILSFYHDQGLFVLIIDGQKINLFSLASAKGNLRDVHEHQSILKENEEIFKISLLNNEQNSTFLIYTTTLCRVFFMKITPRKDVYTGFYEYEIIEEELKEKSNIIKSLLNFVKPNRTIENSFILNPNPKNLFKGSNDLNRIFVLTDTTIQRIDFSITKHKVNKEISPHIHISSIIIDNLKAHLKTSKNLTSKDYCIEAADIFYDSAAKVSRIYFILKFSLENRAYFYFYHFEINSFHEISNMKISYIEGADTNSVYRTGLFVNKLKCEGFLIYSNKSNTQISYFSDLDISRKPVMISHNMKFDINGVSKMNFKNLLEIYLFSFNEGIIYLFVKDEKLENLDKTEEFMKKLNETEDDSMISFSMSNRKYHSVENSVIMNDEITILPHFKELLEKFIEKKISSIEVEKLKMKLREMKIESKLSILDKTILACLDDETENVDFPTRDSAYAEVSIIDYLNDKSESLYKIKLFCDYIDFFGSFDENNKLFLCYLTYLEKLSVAKELRIVENLLIQQSGYQNYSDIFQDMRDIFLYAFSQVKSFYESVARSKSFVKRSLYSKISRFEEYINEIYKSFKKFTDVINIGKERKYKVTSFFLNVFNDILKPIIEIHRESSDKLSNLPEIADLFDLYFYYEDIKIVEREYNVLKIFADNLLYLHDRFYSIYCNTDNQKKFEEIKTKCIMRIYKKNHEHALYIAEKYADYYSIVRICYDHRLINKLLTNMHNKDLKDFRRYALRQYLILEIGSKNNNFFSFFENFAEFRTELKELSDKFPKIAFLYRLFLNYYDNLNFADIIFFSDNDNLQNKLDFIKISKLMNCISERNFVPKRDVDMEVDNTQALSPEMNFMEANFYFILNYVKMRFNLPAKECNFYHIINELLNVNENQFNGVISKKYLISLQLLRMALSFPMSTYAKSHDEHNMNIETLYQNLIEKALLDDIKNGKILLQNFKESFNLNNFNEFSDEQKKFFIRNSIIEILKEKMGINSSLAKEILESEEFKKKTNSEMLEEYKNIFNNFK